MPAPASRGEPDRIRCPLFGGSVDIEVCLACRRLLRVADGARREIGCAVLNDALWRDGQRAWSDRRSSQRRGEKGG